MILEQIKTLEIEHIGDTEDGYAAGITEESMPFVFEFMSTQMYSNPIGSLIREITSNCFDSHVEAGVEDPVIISKTYSIEEGFAIEFQDVGVGMSPDRMTKVFSNYFSSTKRENNSQIGGFGIGSKTPLAYADLFYITTVFEGMEYEYIYHKGEDKPMLESLKGYDHREEDYEVEEACGTTIYTRTIKIPIGTPTTKRNGTVIKINVASLDIFKFAEELKFQLAYFDNVWFKGWSVSNDYDIYEGKYFKFRSDIEQHKTQVHICLGNVRYPIDTTKVKIPSYALGMPVAVKFDIGELRITPSREGIRYTKEDVAKIQERMELAYREVQALFLRDNPVTDNINTFITLQKSVPKLSFDDSKGHSMYVWVGANISRVARFKPLEGLPIKTPNSLFFRWDKIGYFDGTKINMRGYADTLGNEWLRDGATYCIVPKGQMSIYTFLYIQRELVGNTYGSIILIRKSELASKAQYASVISMLGLKGKSKLEDKGDESLLGKKTKTVLQYNKVIDGIVREKAYDYSKIVVPEEWIAAYKRSIIESTAAYQRKINKLVYLRNIVTGGSGLEMKVGDLIKRKGTMVYGYSADRKLLDNIFQTMSGISGRMFRSTKRIMIVQVAQGALKEVVHENSNIIYCTNFLRSYQFRKLVTMVKYKSLLDSGKGGYPYGDFRKIINHFLKDYQKDYDELNKIASKYNAAYNYVEEELVELIPELLVPVYRFKEKYDQVVAILKDSLIGNLYYSSANNPELIVYMKDRHIRLKNEFYLKSPDTLKKERIVRLWKEFCITQSKVLLETNRIKLLTN